MPKQSELRFERFGFLSTTNKTQGDHKSMSRRQWMTCMCLSPALITDAYTFVSVQNAAPLDKKLGVYRNCQGIGAVVFITGRRLVSSLLRLSFMMGMSEYALRTSKREMVVATRGVENKMVQALQQWDCKEPEENRYRNLATTKEKKVLLFGLCRVYKIASE